MADPKHTVPDPTDSEKRYALAVFETKHKNFKNYCDGRQFYDVLKAMRYAEEKTPGFRKDKKTPAFQHQLEIAEYATTLKGLSIESEQRLLIVIMLHDVVEDNMVPLSEIETLFGLEIAKDVDAISKKVMGVKKSNEQYRAGLESRIFAILAKGCDRVNNMQTMRGGVFSFAKQAAYSQEVRDFYLPLLRHGRNIEPQYRAAIHNIKLMLTHQVQWVEEMLQAIQNNVALVLGATLKESTVSRPPSESLGLT